MSQLVLSSGKLHVLQAIEHLLQVLSSTFKAFPVAHVKQVSLLLGSHVRQFLLHFTHLPVSEST